MLSGFFTCLFDFWVLFCWSFFKCKKSTGNASEKMGNSHLFIMNLPACPKFTKTYWAIILFLTNPASIYDISMIFIHFLIQRNSGNYEINQKNEKLNHFQLVNAKDGARHTGHTRHRHTRHSHTGHPWEASEGSSSCARKVRRGWQTDWPSTTFKDWTSNNWLVGGWTNPFEKYERQIGNLPQIGLKMKNMWVATT